MTYPWRKKGIKWHKYARKKRKGHRKKGILWDYDWDGMFGTERIKGKDKMYWKKWRRRTNKESLKENIDESK